MSGLVDQGYFPRFDRPMQVTTVAWMDVTGKPVAFAPAAHTHAIGDTVELQTVLDGKQPAGSYALTGHTHVIADVTGLQAALNSKQAAGSYALVGHTHAIADVVGLQAALDGKQAAGGAALVFVGNALFTETVAIALTVAPRRRTLTLNGVALGDKLMFAPTGQCAAGCEVLNIYASALNQITLSFISPTLAVGAQINLAFAVYRLP